MAQLDKLFDALHAFSMDSPQWIDAHCHLSDPRLLDDFEAVLSRSRAQSVTAWVQGGVGPEDWQRQLEVQTQLGNSYATCFGLHPWWVAKYPHRLSEGLQLLEGLLPKAHLLGEIGLDHHSRFPRETWPIQKQALEAQLALLRHTPKPIAVHCVRAHDQVLAILEAHGPFPRGGLVHSFSGDLAAAGRYRQLNLYLSLSGKAPCHRPEFQRVLAELPSESFLIETDSPDQALPEWKVTRNEPMYLRQVAEKLAPYLKTSAPDLLFQSRAILLQLLA